jgi:small subunit ribosomal protein S20
LSATAGRRRRRLLGEGLGGGGQGRYSTALHGAPAWRLRVPAKSMANIHSQKKRILRSERERLENRRYTSAIKTHFRHLQEQVQAGEGDGAEQTHRVLVSTIDKAVKRGALHRNTGDRKKSRAARVLAGSDGS